MMMIKIEKITKSTIEMSIEKKVAINLHFTRNVVVDKYNEIVKPFGISMEQYNVLRILRCQKGNPIYMTDIQERMITKNSNTTRLIDKLLEKKLVTRHECPDNRRKVEVLITKNGLDLLLLLDQKIIDCENRFASNLTEFEIESFNYLLEKYRIL